MILLKQIQLPNGQATTNLGFGCAGILRVYTSRYRESLLKTAFEEGITHFDVARMYGMGTAEGIVGTSLKSSRNQLTIATKFGLPYETPAGLSLKIHSVARSALNLSPPLKKAVKKLAAKSAALAAPEARGKSYSIQEMEQSLHTSLRQLQTDRVDLLFVHEPSRNDFIPDPMAEALRGKKASGEIGTFGLSGNRSELEYFLETRPDLCQDALQYNDSIFTKGSGIRPLRHVFTGRFGVLSGSYPQLARHLAENANFRKTWSAQLSLDLHQRENVGAVILAIALLLNPQGIVLFFTSKSDRLRRVVHLLRENSFSSENLSAFRNAASQLIHAN